MTSRLLTGLALLLSLTWFNPILPWAQTTPDPSCTKSFAPLASKASQAVSSEFSQDPSLRALKDLYGAALEIEDRAPGPWLYLRAEQNTRNIASIDELKIASYNMLNIIEMKGKYVTDPVTGARLKVAEEIAKPKEKLIEQGQVILRENPDIFFAQEVESLDAAEILNDEHLGGQYRPVVIHGVDQRGIQIVAFFKKDLPFDIEVQSHRNVTGDYMGKTEEVFSRDLPVFKIRPKGASRKDEPLMIFMGQHMKSKRDGFNDPQSSIKRNIQADKSVELLLEYEKQHPTVPILPIGDFNGDLRSDKEFEPFWKKGGLKDSFDLAAKTIPRDQVITHTYHPKGGATNFSQLDGILVSKAGQKPGLILEAKVVPYLDANGKPKPIPKTRQERDENPSDHRMILIRVAFQKLLSAHSPGN